MSQFSAAEEKSTLKDLFPVPRDVYPVGRLDYDSEGLLILTNDKKLNALLLHPLHSHEREYWVQVEGVITSQAIRRLEQGVSIKAGGKHFKTQPCIVKKFEKPPSVPDRDPPIRVRKNIPDTWIRIIVSEGKNRQVRKMTAAVGHPTLRLIRYRIENATIADLQPGEMKTLTQQELYNLLKIQNRYR